MCGNVVFFRVRTLFLFGYVQNGNNNFLLFVWELGTIEIGVSFCKVGFFC